MTDDCFENLSLLVPKKLTKAIAHPPDRIGDLRVLGWVEEIGENRPFGSPSHAASVCLKPNKEPGSVIARGLSG
jgi:hypothetical protein